MLFRSTHGDKSDPGFVLPSLLGRTDLGQRSQATIDHALKWLGTHGAKFDAQFVLAPLLKRTDLGQSAQTAIDHALEWLGTHGEKPEARFALAPLMERTDLGTRSQATIDHALRWLVVNRSEPGADFVFTRVLRKRDLPDSEWQRVATIAVGWLGSTPDNQHGWNRALYSLLARPEKLAFGDREKVAEHSVSWLTKHSAEKSADRMPAALSKLQRTLPANHPITAEIRRVIGRRR